MGHPLRVPGGERDGHRIALRHAEEREALQSGVLNDRLEIGDPGLQRHVVHVAVREPATALVVPEQRVPLAQLRESVAPDRALPVELQTREPCRRAHQRTTPAMRGIRDARAVGRPAEADPCVGTA